MSKTILIQEHLRRALPVVLGCWDYRQQEQLLVRVDRILRERGGAAFCGAEPGAIPSVKGVSPRI
jgi:hypothetical protein